MSFLDCIATAVESGRLSGAKAAEASEAFEEAKEALRAAGHGEDVAEEAASHEALKAVTGLKYAQRRARISQLRKEERAFKQIMGSKEPGFELQKLAQEAEDYYHEAFGRMGRIVNQYLMKYSPKAGGFVEPLKDMNDVVFGVYGRTVGPEASDFTRAIQDFVHFERDLLNGEGAAVPENPNYRLWQTQDSGRVYAAGVDEWVNDHLAADVTDWDIVRYAGKPIEPQDRERILREVIWPAISTRGKNRQNVAAGSAETLATRLSRERFIYYKTPEAYIKMQDKYGTGNFYHQLVEQMDSAARSYSLLRVYGPNPKAGREFMARAAEKRTAELKLAAKTTKAGEKIETKTSNQIVAFKEQYDIHSRELDTGAGDAVAMLGATARTMSATAVLGHAIIANLSDVFYSSWLRYANGLPWLSTIPRYVNALTHYKDFRQQAIDNGIAWQTLTNRAYESTRHTFALEGNALARKISDIQYRISGLSQLTQIGKTDTGFLTAQVLGKSRELNFDDIPFSHILRTFGITENDWNLVRETPLYEPQFYNFGKGRMLRPIDMLAEAGSQAQADAANKFLMFQEAMVRDGIPQPNLRTRQFLGGASPRGQLRTQVFQSMTQLMLFPAGMHFQMWRRILQAPTRTEKLKLLGGLIAVSALSGVMVAQMKDLLNGKKLHPMNTKEFWIRAMVIGGAGGIIGDFLYNSALFAVTPYRMETPIGQQFSNLSRLTVGNLKAAATGEELHFGADLANAAWGLAPFKLPGIKLIMERAILDGILEWSDPAAYQRRLRWQRRQELEQGQGTWWGVGEDPDFGEIFN